MYAEWKKSKDGQLDKGTKRILEVFIPSFSVLALLAVTGYITADAINIIQNGDDGDEVNVYFLFAFASANFLVDLVSSFMFYRRGKEVLISSPISHDRRSVECFHNYDFSSDHSRTPSNVPSAAPNLNMISALTHVGSDTLRTISVFVAAVISVAGKQDPSLCDAWAAIAVTVTIILAVIPLINEIIKSILRKDDEEATSRSENNL